MTDNRIDLKPWGSHVEVLEPLAGGARNLSWLVSINGQKAAARRSRRTQDALDWELDLMLAANAAGVSTPRVVPTVDGRRHAGSVVLFEWIDGRKPESTHDWAMVRDALQRLHGATSNWRQRPGFSSMANLLIEARGGDVDLSLIPEGIVEECRAAWQATMDDRTSAIHGDPSSNVLLVDGEPTFIDWDESRVDACFLDFALPQVDLLDEHQKRALVAWEIACSWILEPEYARRRLVELRAS
jgi:Ser/Thr protein kinase RdoA (MazF antagonist)